MVRRKKNKGVNKASNSSSVQKNNADFDLKKSLGKLNQRKSLPETFTSTEYGLDNDGSRPISSDYFANESLDETQLLLDINNRFSDKFDSLRSDIHITEERISQNTDKLRCELEGKLEKKVSRELFVGAVSAIIIIAGIIYALSYSHIEKKVDNNQVKSQNNENLIKKNQDDINSNEDDIEELEKKVYKLEIEKTMPNKP